ncbi:ATP-dependent DNA ligase [Luteimicrobium subarcticum]|uniref:DNA ligase (ATP) n=1 Tax=Luteimicrobium subarcticum TaxID=620910 RepID=A0A2M8WRN0_9MICO|nr:ATP-dependent DNA ligase [Luteimicrobium subarcticum]PJI93597.1 ATP-dependent DNA ligase [Luteimicrobium subarcticum]
MDLPVLPPVLPMLAKAAPRIPRSSGGSPGSGDRGDSGREGWSYEPKWDGFRCVVFRDGDDVELGSRNTKPLTRYFPEVVEAVRAALPERCVVDGELVIPRSPGPDESGAGARLDFDLLQNRIHPAASRVELLSRETPASLVVFDLLALDDDDLTGLPLAERRVRLEAALGSAGTVASDADLPLGAVARVHLSQVTHDPDEAQRWFEQFEGAGLDGVVAKPLASTYQPDKRGWTKVKHERTADVVVAGYRLHKASTDAEPLLGSLLLALFDDDGVLHHVGVAASFPMARRAELVAELDRLRVPLDEHPWARWQTDATSGDSRLPGGVSRWNAKKDLSFVPLDPVLVAEVRYEHMEGDRFRHTAQLVRWRDDRDADSCTYTQLEEVPGFDLAEVLSR